MKPISSAISGLANRAQAGESSTGSAHGEIGYGERRRRSSEPEDEYQPPAVRTEPSVPATDTKRCFADLPPLPELKPVITRVIETQREFRTSTGLALANPEDRVFLRSLMDQIHEELKPATRREIAAQLVQLFYHYPAQAGADMAAVAADWQSDMADVSAKAFFAACHAWRRSTNRFRPTPGQLLAIIAELEEPLRKKLATCKQLEAMEG